MNLDIIARLVKILQEAPELGAIEVRRGLFGTWSSVRVSKAGVVGNAGGGGGGGGGHHVVVAQGPATALSPAAAGEGGRGGGEAPPSPLVEIKSPMVGTFYSAP